MCMYLQYVAFMWQRFCGFSFYFAACMWQLCNDVCMCICSILCIVALYNVMTYYNHGTFKRSNVAAS